MIVSWYEETLGFAVKKPSELDTACGIEFWCLHHAHHARETLVKRPGTDRQVSERVSESVIKDIPPKLFSPCFKNGFGTDKCQIMGEMFQGWQGHASCSLGRRRPSCEEAHHANGRYGAHHGQSSNLGGCL